MPIIKCKMCGGDLELIEGSSVCECEYCGTKQTVPTADNDKKLTLFARANRLRAANEFDKAAGVYENLVADFPEEAEAYWGLVLCRYGIEYVDDPATGKKIPTCHRSSFDSILEDEDFEQACENADAIARRVYREEAKAIEDIRRGILEISGKEEPYDIFICYKETDDNGDRTIDSVLAQDVYDALTAKGYRVFFSRISLEDKLGTEYEPYIFAALNSAKIMLVFGTDYEYFNAVWVKNEWSRFLALMARGEKKTLIPCYKDVDAYDMPKEFRRLQAQDMGKVGAVQDLLRGIEKILGPQEKLVDVRTQPQTIIQATGPNAESLLRRGELALEDGDWEGAKDFFNRVLDMLPESAEAYLGLAMVEEKCRDRNVFQTAYTNVNCKWRKSRNMERARQFGGGELLSWLEQLDNEIDTKAEEEIRIAKEKAEAERKNEEKHRAYEMRVAEIKRSSEAELNEQIASIHTNYLNRVKQLREDKERRSREARERKNALEARKKQLIQDIAMLGLFEKKRKKELASQLIGIDEEIAQLPPEYLDDQEYQAKRSELKHSEEDEILQMREEIKTKFRIPSFDEFQME